MQEVGNADGTVQFGALVTRSFHWDGRMVVAETSSWSGARYAPSGTLLYLQSSGGASDLMARDDGRNASRLLAAGVVDFWMSEDRTAAIYLAQTQNLPPSDGGRAPGPIGSIAIDGASPPVSLTANGALVWPPLSTTDEGDDTLYVVEESQARDPCIGPYGRLSRVAPDGRSTEPLAEAAALVSAHATSGRAVVITLDDAHNRTFSALFPRENASPQLITTLGRATYARRYGCAGDWIAPRFTPDGSKLFMTSGWSGGDTGLSNPGVNLVDLMYPEADRLSVDCNDWNRFYVSLSARGFPCVRDGGLWLMGYDGSSTWIDDHASSPVESVEPNGWVYSWWDGQRGEVRLFDADTGASPRTISTGPGLLASGHSVFQNRWVRYFDPRGMSAPQLPHWHLADLATGRDHLLPSTPYGVLAGGRVVHYGDGLAGPMP